MVNYREILRLLELGYTQRDIARSIHCSCNTVRDVQYLSKELGIRWPLDDNVTNVESIGQNRGIPRFSWYLNSLHLILLVIVMESVSLRDDGSISP